MSKLFELCVSVELRLRMFAKNLLASPKSSAVGIVAIANGCRLLVADPIGFLTNEAAILSFLVGAGLLFTADQSARTNDSKESKEKE